MAAKFYSLIFFLVLFWFYCFYWGFRTQRNITTPVDFYIFNREMPGWAYILISTGVIFSGWVFFIHPSLIFFNGIPYSMVSLAAIGIPLIGILFSKRQWMLSKRYGFVTPGEMIGTYFKSDLLRILIVVITLGFAIPFIAVQLALGGALLSVVTNNGIASGSGSVLIGLAIVVYISLGGLRSIFYIDTLQFLFFIFGIITLGFITVDLVGGWDLLNESLSRVSNIKKDMFNIKENYSAYLSVPGSIKLTEILDGRLVYNGLWTSSLIFSFIFGLSGILMSPNFSMLTFSSKEVSPFATQQIWFSGFLLGFVLMFFTIVIGLGSVLLGGSEAINTSGNNISKIIPESLFPNEILNVVPSIINVTGDYSPLLFGVLVICSLAAIQSSSYFYLSTSAIVNRDILKKFFIKNMNNKEQIFSTRILIGVFFIFSLIVSLQPIQTITSIFSFSLAIACQMFVPLLAICYWKWLTRHGVAFGIVVGILAVILTDSLGQILFPDLLKWNKWPLTIHSSVWGVIFNFLSAVTISFITQDIKEINYKHKFHDFISDFKSSSILRRSLKPSAWILTVAWIFFSIGPGVLIGNNIFGKPGNIETWSFGIPSLWVWQIISWALGIMLIWFLAKNMEMSTSPDKKIIAQTEDFGNTRS
tara:strand:+ start:1 stop:1932 length:1932 start_codon:yes stop_codon:yes gene_type:complete